jgi:hypothetical protein
VSERKRHLASIANTGHLAALTGGSTVFFHWGNDKEHLRDRVAHMRLVLIGANRHGSVLDPALRFPRRLRTAPHDVRSG